MAVVCKYTEMTIVTWREHLQRWSIQDKQRQSIREASPWVIWGSLITQLIDHKVRAKSDEAMLETHIQT